MTFLSFDSRRAMMTAGLAAFLGFAAIAGQGGAAAAHAGDAQAMSPANKVTLAAQPEKSNRDNATDSANRSASRQLLVQIAPPAVAEKPAAAAVVTAPAKVEAPKAPEKPAEPTPVAGLDQTQMNNAKKIVEEAQRMGLGKRAEVIAIATALQESKLYNLASSVYPESFDLTNEGYGSDHDSVGLFQQRPQSGWGTVQNILKPEYAAHAFLSRLVEVPGWDQMPLTYAAQAVQVSAFPEAYAPHEDRANQIVDALQ